MFRVMCKSKIHRAKVTDADLNYEGSITIDKALMEAADIYPNERVQVLNLNNGERAETYVIEGQAHSGIICLNGAIARMAQKGDLVIIISYAIMNDEEARTYTPKIIRVDENNQMLDDSRNIKVN